MLKSSRGGAEEGPVAHGRDPAAEFPGSRPTMPQTSRTPDGCTNQPSDRISPTPVVRIITRLNIGGPARQALLLTRDMPEQFSTRLVTGTAPEEEGELTDADVALTRVSLVRPVRPHLDARAYRALSGILAGDRPAIVHTHMAKAGLLGRLAAFRSSGRPRTVHTFHGHVLEGYFGRTMNRAFLHMERTLAARTDVLVAVSEQTRDDLLRLGIGRPDQYRVVPLGLELHDHLKVAGPSGHLRAALGLGPEVPLVGVVGRLVPIKDHLGLLRAMVRLPDAHLAVLGDGPLRASLEVSAAELGVTARTHFLGWWSDIPGAMADLDVVALSSRNEGTPVALIEAGACARPVVASDVGGVRSVVEDGVTGYLVPAEDSAALAERLSELLGDPGRGRRMGEAGRTRVAARFGAQRLVGDMTDLYRQLVG